MAVRKVSISMPEEVAEEAVRAARSEGLGLSAWVSDAVLARLGERARLEIGRRAARELVEDWEAEHGPMPADAVDWADGVLEQIVGHEPGASGDRTAG